MRRRVRAAFTYSNVLATLSLFIVLGGGAYAAKTHLIDGRVIKARSIAGGKLKNNAVTGKQVKESTLQQVPDAAKLGGRPASAYQPAGSYQPAGDYLAAGGTAADAAKLGGRAPSAYLAADRVLTASGATDSIPAATVLTYAPLGLVVKTDGDADGDSSLTLQNDGATRFEVSNPQSTGINVVDPGGSAAVSLSGSRVGTWVIRQAGPGANTSIGAMLTCGFDFAPNVTNCVLIGIG